MEKIDFVVLWVDGNDPAWLAERAKYLPGEDASVTAVNRFRDWGLMKYWFRGVEKYAPWVNHVYFVTWGHYPEWLNPEHPKLTIVKHTDYIPEEYLPTFNSNVIELNLHRIQSLSEHFVLFNDDTFLIDYVRQEDFFRKGLPCETVRLGSVYAEHPDDIFPHTVLRNMSIINKHFRKEEVMKRFWYKFFSPRYGTGLLRNLLLAPFKYFSSFYDTHLPASHLKSTFFEVWTEEQAVLKDSATHRFRSWNDVTHWLIKCWRFCQGKFVPRSNRWGRYFVIGKDQELIKTIEKQKYRAICINDGDPDLDFEKCQAELVEAFELILPEKSAFEK